VSYSRRNHYDYLSPDKRLIKRKIEQIQIYYQSHFHFVKERDTEVSNFPKKAKNNEDAAYASF